MTAAKAQVRSITDGDTIRATIFVPGAFGTQVVLDETIGGWPIRLLGVDAPEKSDKVGWARAAAYTAEVVQPGDWITIYSPDNGKLDAFRRVLAAVETADGQDLGQLLLDAELATPWSRTRAAEFGFEGSEWTRRTAVSAPPSQPPVMPAEARDRSLARLRYALTHGDRMAEALDRWRTGDVKVGDADQLARTWHNWRIGHGG